MKHHVGSRRFALVVATGLTVLGLVTPSAGAQHADGSNGDGGGVSPQIIGGSPAPVGAYPFMAALLNEGIAGDDYQKQFCGGALISPTWVLTAAHCVEGASPDDLAVAVGRTVLSSNQGQRRDVTEVHVHPQFDDPVPLAHDAALLRLESAVTDQAPIRLATAADDGFEAAGTPLTVIGWGNTNAKGRPSFPDQLMQVTVPAVSDTTCGTAYGSSLDPPTMLCAGVQGKDSCQGDSGGPLFATAGDGSRVHMGVVSWGIGCGRRRFPGVYGETNNAEIRGWITQVSGV